MQPTKSLQFSMHTIGAVAMAVLLSACATSSPPPPPAPVLVRPTLPEPPATFGLPVPAPSVREGMDAREALGRYALALRQANRRLTDARSFYCDVVAEFGIPSDAASPPDGP